MTLRRLAFSEENAKADRDYSPSMARSDLVLLGGAQTGAFLPNNPERVFQAKVSLRETLA